MKVKIVLSGTDQILNYAVNSETSKFVSSSNSYKINTNEFFSKLISIIKYWPHELEDSAIQDGLSCIIMISNNGEESFYTFHNKFPQNFNDLVNLVQYYERGDENGSVN